MRGPGICSSKFRSHICSGLAVESSANHSPSLGFINDLQTGPTLLPELQELADVSNAPGEAKEYFTPRRISCRV